jgi:hypothetical protein
MKENLKAFPMGTLLIGVKALCNNFFILSEMLTNELISNFGKINTDEFKQFGLLVS